MSARLEEVQDTLTKEPGNRLLGVVLVAFDKDGIFYSKAAGQRRLDSADPVTIDNTFWGFSCTKLLTTICALQCVERGQVGLDDSVGGVLPELAAPQVITPSKNTEQAFTISPARGPITLRHLLTHTSGLAYDAMQPILREWRKSRDEPFMVMSGRAVPTAHNLPLLFEPGQGWVYGAGLDWAGVLVERLNGGVRLGAYMEANIFGPLRLTSSTLRLPEARPEIKKRLLQMTTRIEKGELVGTVSPLPEDPEADSGGMGLITSTADFVAILSELLRDDSVLLAKELVAQMFTPQFEASGPRYEGLMAQQALHKDLTGDKTGTPDVAFGLGGLVIMTDVPNLAAKSLTWNGMPNIGWFVNREKEIGAVYASQLLPACDPSSMSLLAEFWKVVGSSIQRHGAKSSAI